MNFTSRAKGPNLIKIGQKVAEIWWFNGFQNCSCPPSRVYEIGLFLTVVAVKRPILHQHTKFSKDRSNRCGDIAIFVIYQEGGRRRLGFSKIQNFNGRPAVGGPYASLCQISSKSVKRLQRYGNLTVFKMAAVRHLGFVKLEFFNSRSGFASAYQIS